MARLSRAMSEIGAHQRLSWSGAKEVAVERF